MKPTIPVGIKKYNVSYRPVRPPPTTACPQGTYSQKALDGKE
jgi:hypothetical protein